MVNNLTRNNLSTVLWNANGLLQHKNEFEIFLYDNRIDIALITETHFTPTVKFKIPGYSVYRTDHPDNRAHGGSAVFIKSNLKHYLMPLDPPDNSFQATAISISIKNLRLSVGVIYCPPRFIITPEQFKSLYRQLGCSFILGGDFNAKHQQWGCRITNTKGRTLLKSVLHNNISVLSPGSPTYWPTARTKLPDILDIFLSRGINSLNLNTRVLHDLSSDHSPVNLELSASPERVIPPPKLNSESLNWDLFRENVNHQINLTLPLKSPFDVEYAVENFNKTIQEAAWSASTSKPHYKMFGPVYPAEIRRLIQEKRRARHIWQRTRAIEDRRLLNRLSNVIKKKTQSIKRDQYNQHLSALSDTNRSLWTTTKKLMKHTPISSPLRRQDDTWAKSDKEKADHFAEHLASVFTPNPDIIDVNFAETITNNLNAAMPLSLPPPPFTIAEVRNAVLKLPPKKAPGYDLITGEVLKQLPDVAIRFLTYIFNSVLRTTHFPIQWKHSIISVILKPSKPAHHASSYRPISLLPVVGKIFERLLLHRLLPLFQHQIPPYQFGFRKNHSTIQQLQRVVDYISLGLEQKEYTVGVFLDVNAAFDRVWHDGLLHKIKQILPDTYYRILLSFLSERYFKVRINNSFSDLHEIKAGVPQGSILSPLLYSMYTSDFPNSANTLLATYADDTAILTRSPNPVEASQQLQHHLNAIEIWLKRWRIKINAEKSLQVSFTLRRGICPPLFLSNTRIPADTKVKYLGLILDKRLSWKQHISSKRVLLNNRLKILFSLVNSRSPLPLRLKLRIYSSLLRPIWFYGSSLFGSAKKSNIKTLQAFQYKYLRLITGAPWYIRSDNLHRDLQIPPVTEVIKWQSKKFFQKLHNHENTLVQELSNRNIPDIRRLKRMWSRDFLRD